jgi:PTH1 family peptidyl-tRNA hydrolase
LRLILGIGNPGNKYRFNRHNVGFVVLDHLASARSLSFKASKADYYFAEGSLNGNAYQFIRPSTYVNNSGIAAKQALENNNLNVEDLLVVHDDVNLPHAEIRVKVRGGDGGHNGLSSIIWHLMSEEFSRLRIGIGDNFEKGYMAEYVLSDFSTEEMKLLESAFKTVETLVDEFITGGMSGLLDANSRLSNLNKNPENNNQRT